MFPGVYSEDRLPYDSSMVPLRRLPDIAVTSSPGFGPGSDWRAGDGAERYWLGWG
jgi:hypothetical protein